MQGETENLLLSVYFPSVVQIMQCSTVIVAPKGSSRVTVFRHCLLSPTPVQYATSTSSCTRNFIEGRYRHIARQIYRHEKSRQHYCQICNVVSCFLNVLYPFPFLFILFYYYSLFFPSCVFCSGAGRRSLHSDYHPVLTLRKATYFSLLNFQAAAKAHQLPIHC